MKRAILAFVAVAILSGGVLVAQAATSDSECTAAQADFFIRMRCIAGKGLDAFQEIIRLKKEVPPSKLGKESESIVPVDRFMEHGCL